MRSLHDELTNGVHPACKVCAYLAELDTYNQGEWKRELALPIDEIPHAKVVAALRVRGVIVDEASVRRHRKNHAL